MIDQTKIAFRRGANSPRHHLWNNNGTWWCHFTFHLPGYTRERFRVSLETNDLAHARRLRDSLLALFGIDPRSQTVSEVKP